MIIINQCHFGILSAYPVQGFQNEVVGRGDPGVALIMATNVLWEVRNEKDFAR
jgi:hypothetical protein